MPESSDPDTDPDFEPTSDDEVYQKWLDDLVDRYMAAAEQIDKATTLTKQLSAQLLDALPPGGSHETAPGYGVRVQAPSRQFKPELARKILTEDQLQAISEMVPQVKLAEKYLPGILVDQCRVAVGDPYIKKLGSRNKP